MRWLNQAGQLAKLVGTHAGHRDADSMLQFYSLGRLSHVRGECVLDVCEDATKLTEFLLRGSGRRGGRAVRPCFGPIHGSLCRHDDGSQLTSAGK